VQHREHPQDIRPTFDREWRAGLTDRIGSRLLAHMGRSKGETGGRHLRKFFLGLSAAALSVLIPFAPREAQGQQKDKAPAGCIRCEELCTWCVSLGRQPKAELGKCHQGCRSWGSMVGQSTVYVHKNRSLCGTGSYAPRCN
jgi:hypothetical protein